ARNRIRSALHDLRTLAPSDIERAPHAADDRRNDQAQTERLDIFMKVPGRLRAHEKQRHDQKHHDGADRKASTLLIFTQFAQSLHCRSTIPYLSGQMKSRPKAAFPRHFEMFNAEREPSSSDGPRASARTRPWRF